VICQLSSLYNSEVTSVAAIAFSHKVTLAVSAGAWRCHNARDRSGNPCKSAPAPAAPLQTTPSHRLLRVWVPRSPVRGSSCARWRFWTASVGRLPWWVNPRVGDSSKSTASGIAFCGEQSARRGLVAAQFRSTLPRFSSGRLNTVCCRVVIKPWRFAAWSLFASYNLLAQNPAWQPSASHAQLPIKPGNPPDAAFGPPANIETAEVEGSVAAPPWLDVASPTYDGGFFASRKQYRGVA